MSPGQWLTQQRVDLARQLLKSSELPVSRIAERVGFGTGATLRHHSARRDRGLPGRLSAHLPDLHGGHHQSCAAAPSIGCSRPQEAWIPCKFKMRPCTTRGNIWVYGVW
ncbi:helix-turn-helix domain-containing protein [Streptomyces sp. ISID311]|uniref:helix-turn-helix domain-containing protein n=1 Tax=Streptomyces sp. ISID311 TaxID=2601673 RepID=UPI0021C3E573|nr:helix-turn-helix domain-containing protein [Streptomyces sp. ISID311]